jgi:hypothetical protein
MDDRGTCGPRGCCGGVAAGALGDEGSPVSFPLRPVNAGPVQPVPTATAINAPKVPIYDRVVIWRVASPRPTATTIVVSDAAGDAPFDASCAP